MANKTNLLKHYATIPEYAELRGIHRRHVYDRVQTGEIQVVTVGYLGKTKMIYLRRYGRFPFPGDESKRNNVIPDFRKSKKKGTK